LWFICCSEGIFVWGNWGLWYIESTDGEENSELKGDGYVVVDHGS
jgi:hypothetical protein